MATEGSAGPSMNIVDFINGLSVDYAGMKNLTIAAMAVLLADKIKAAEDPAAEAKRLRGALVDALATMSFGGSERQGKAVQIHELAIHSAGSLMSMAEWTAGLSPDDRPKSD